MSLACLDGSSILPWSTWMQKGGGGRLPLFAFLHSVYSNREKSGSQTVSGVLFCISKVCHLSGLTVAGQFYRATLWRKRCYSDGQPSTVSLHALSSLAMHTSCITAKRCELLPHILTLACYEQAVVFFCITAFSRILPVRKRGVLRCPDFPQAGRSLPATDHPALHSLFDC